MNSFHQFVAEYARLAREGKGYPLGNFPKCPRPQIAPDAPKALIFSPHPDDEVIVGALALRLLREAKWNVINVAVTQGSLKARRAERLAELKACCDHIGFGLLQTAPDGLEGINVETRQRQSAAWAQSVEAIASILAAHRPSVVFVPHEGDGHGTHIGTHYLVLDALRSLPADFACLVVETEFWRPMESPGLMVEVSAQDLGDLIAALSFHAGEVRRNPYHLSLPAWMIDNVRRGAELVGGQGGAAPDFTFATLYRLRKWLNGKLENVPSGKWLSAHEDPAGLFGL